MLRIGLLSTYILSLLLALSFTSCTEDDNDDGNGNSTQLSAECVSIFTDLEGSAALVAGGNTGGPGVDFTDGSSYQVTFTSAGKTTIASNAGDYVFEAADITSCDENGTEVNVFYQKNTLNLIVQVDGETIQLVLSDANGQVTLTYTPGPDVSLITPHAGTYNVAAVGNGTHDRMTVVIGTDGSIDFDTNVSFSPTDYQLISDRIACCDAVYIDCSPYPSEPYPRVELEIISGNLTGITYRPNYPNSGSVEVSF